jgi:hypothetical protein
MIVVIIGFGNFMFHLLCGELLARNDEGHAGSFTHVLGSSLSQFLVVHPRKLFKVYLPLRRLPSGTLIACVF